MFPMHKAESAFTQDCSPQPCFLVPRFLQQGRTQVGVGLKLFEFICYKNFFTCAKEISCFRILFAYQFVDLMQIPRKALARKIQGTL